ncbi:hypothetical protein BDP55DRAFT_678017 [Colletotrichum godetiae]|uniref:Uncharacterized protein n=1 Tax=Colletotrichum godetiae TaxID=1209918 RepID=A0AAJ0ACL6_9PEZI|nr:uncharacterized protein BDP55DRAFT_678017 [Colletotrichum godetiae]KAK1660023.1 hypothetical protein BDP55DRAFT_678017 [Colletotrichum godetiae]
MEGTSPHLARLKQQQYLGRYLEGAAGWWRALETQWPDGLGLELGLGTWYSGCCCCFGSVPCSLYEMMVYRIRSLGRVRCSCCLDTCFPPSV